MTDLRTHSTTRPAPEGHEASLGQAPVMGAGYADRGQRPLAPSRVTRTHWSLTSSWRGRVRLLLLVADAAVLLTCLLLAFRLRFGLEPVFWTPLTVVVFALVWLLALVGCGAYEVRVLGVGAEEARRVLRASFIAGVAVAVGAFALDHAVSRLFVGLALTFGVLGLLAERVAVRLVLHRLRRRSRLMHRVLAVGDLGTVRRLIRSIERNPSAGFTVSGIVLPGQDDRADREGRPVFTGLEGVAAAVRRVGADTVAICSSPQVSPDQIRQLSWRLEGSGVDLVVAPAITQVAGPRVSVHPVAGLPLLHVDEPSFHGLRRIVKSVIDRVAAVVLLVLLSPLLLVVAALVACTSPGPVFFRQLRSGRDGAQFHVLKFRSMHVGADARLEELRAGNLGSGHLFKLAVDPRVTPLGRFLRSTSIDELPQLVNVLTGRMSLVGPRPLAVEHERYRGSERRRLLVKPGITGLWQVSGRAQQSWEEALQLDLYYVENWSMGLDLAILLRTLRVVFDGT